MQPQDTNPATLNNVLPFVYRPRPRRLEVATLAPVIPLRRLPTETRAWRALYEWTLVIAGTLAVLTIGGALLAGLARGQWLAECLPRWF